MTALSCRRRRLLNAARRAHAEAVALDQRIYWRGDDDERTLLARIKAEARARRLRKEAARL